MNPDQLPQTPEPYGPGNYGPLIQQGLAQTGAQVTPNPPIKRKSHLPIIIMAAAGTLVLLIAISVIVVATSGKKALKVTPKAPQSTASQGPQPATAIGITETNNSISQDLSGLNNDKALPPTMLDDKTLGL